MVKRNYTRTWKSLQIFCPRLYTLYTSSNCSIFRVIRPYLEPLSYISNNLFMNRVELLNKFGHEPSRSMTRFIPQVEPCHNASWVLQVGFFVNLVRHLCHLNPCTLVFCFCCTHVCENVIGGERLVCCAIICSWIESNYEISITNHSKPCASFHGN